MFTYNPETGIQEYPISSSWGIILLVLMFQIFTISSLLEIKNFES
jgi:hypothetical protein